MKMNLIWEDINLLRVSIMSRGRNYDKHVKAEAVSLVIDSGNSFLVLYSNRSLFESDM